MELIIIHLLLVSLFGLALVYGYLQGQSTSASVVSTMISSRAVEPRLALLMAAVGIALGPFLVGTAVATTIGAQFVRADRIDVGVVTAGLAGATLWCGVTQWLRLPVSSTHALFGGLIGAAWVGFGYGVVIDRGLIKALLGLLLSPLLGLLFGYGLVQLSYWLSRSAPPRINKWFQRGQVPVSLLLAISLGSNEAQKLIGVLLLGLVASGTLDHFYVPLWVTLFGTLAITIGTVVGGWRLIHTLGGKFYTIRPIHGFGAQTASAGVIFGAALAGWPVSSSQVVVSSIVGAGSAERLRKVRWGVVQQVAMGWLLTLPITAVMSGLLYGLMKGLGR